MSREWTSFVSENILNDGKYFEYTSAGELAVDQTKIAFTLIVIKYFIMKILHRYVKHYEKHSAKEMHLLAEYRHSLKIILRLPTESEFSI